MGPGSVDVCPQVSEMLDDRDGPVKSRPKAVAKPFASNSGVGEIETLAIGNLTSHVANVVVCAVEAVGETSAHSFPNRHKKDVIG